MSDEEDAELICMKGTKCSMHDADLVPNIHWLYEFDCVMTFSYIMIFAYRSVSEFFLSFHTFDHFFVYL